MNYLIDTHCFLWSAFAPQKLSKPVRDILLDHDNNIYVSAVTFWEISLKYAIGKLELRGVTPSDLSDVAKQIGFSIISLEVAEASSFHRLPIAEHRDPFDRMLVWQAINLDMTLVSKDALLNDYEQYGLKVVW